MANVGLIAVGTASLGLLGTYLYFSGRSLVERTLDGIIEFQKRLKGGYYRRLNPNGCCPSCGRKSGEISFNYVIQRVVHTCNICGAQWAELPRLPFHAWDFVGRDVKHVGDKKSDLDAIMERANATSLHKDKAEKAEEKAN